MTEQNASSMSLIDQILENLFVSLDNQKAFDNDLINKLRTLAIENELTKPAKITNVLKTIPRGENETY